MFRRPKPHKWIDAEIARLDPSTEWAQIYRLMTTYRADDFMLDAIYVHTFPRFMVPAHGPVPVWRNGHDAKVVNRAAKRADDTGWHNMIWWYHGPDHPETKKSVATINKIHAHYASSYPEAFLDQDDYLHPLLFTAAAMHKLRLQMGLPGYTGTEKIAAHRFWQEMSALFIVPGGENPLRGFPADFDGVLAWLAAKEDRDWPVNEMGKLTLLAVQQQFLDRYVPRRLHWLARATFNSFYPRSVVSAYEISLPPRPVAAALRRAVGLAMAFGERHRPDPQVSYVERRLSLDAAQRKERDAAMLAQDRAFAARFRPTVGIHPAPDTASSPAPCAHAAAASALRQHGRG